MKKFFNFLYSTRVMAALFFLFALAMGVATFIENDYGTQTSKALIYNSWWFEGIMVFFVINFFGNIFRYRLLRKEKWPVLLFHIAFLLILIGAGITRYIGYEGIMIIEEGETTNTFLSETTYVNVVVDDGELQKPQINEPILLSAWGKNNWSYSDTFKTKEKAQDFSIELVDYIPWAKEEFVSDEDGTDHLFFVESSEGTRHEHWIKSGTIENIHGILVGFNEPGKNATVNFFAVDGVLKMESKVNGDWLRMADQKQGKIAKGAIENFRYLTLHNVGGLQFVIPRPAQKGNLEKTSGKKDDAVLDEVVFEISTKDETKRIALLGKKFNSDGEKEITVGGLNFRIMYGAKILETPFSIKLNDFQLEKYPGSESASSFASEVTVIDPEETFNYRIFMNHILNHKGFKLFQASYDLSGGKEKTHLSVNHDAVGTFVTYLGYSLLYIGMITILFAKYTRFDDLKKALKKIRKKKLAAVFIGALFFSGVSFAQDNHNHEGHDHDHSHEHTTTNEVTHQHDTKKITNAQIDSILQANIVSLEHAESFNKLVIQDAGGRMKPAHTFASELVRKVHKSDNFNGMEPSQVLLSIIENRTFWNHVPIIYLERGNNQLRELIGLPLEAKYAALSDFLTSRLEYKIRDEVAEAQKKNIRNKFEKDLINVDRRVGLLFSALRGDILRIYPIPNDEKNKWISLPELKQEMFSGIDSVFVKQSLPVYVQFLQEGKKTGSFEQADKVLEGIKKFQRKFGIAVYPSEKKIEMEIQYNKLQPFAKLAKFYGFLSLFLIVFVFIKIFSTKKWVNTAVKILTIIALILFTMHTAGLGMRWYISGNAPWSNAYESIIYVAWSVMLFGLAFGKKSELTVAATTFLTAIILAFAHQNWLDPEIANLVPVLNSWWLLVHVSIIVASYGPFALGMILGVFALFLYILTNKTNKKKIALTLQEITIVNEMALTIGLIMLTIGNFLGGMWANESWGRYWGWDPKETWALISIMVYAFVLHMRLIPGLRARYTFNLWSIIAFYAIMMTYFGVNFYLSGLHSYASGDKVITPTSVYNTLGILIVLGTLAYLKYLKYYKK